MPNSLGVRGLAHVPGGPSQLSLQAQASQSQLPFGKRIVDTRSEIVQHAATRT